MFRRLRSYSRLKGNEVLLVFVIHFASDDIRDIHHCWKRGGGKVSHYCRTGCTGSILVCNISQMASFCERRQVLGHNEFLPKENVWLLVGYGGSGVLIKAPLLRCHFTQLLREILYRKVKKKVRRVGGGGKWCVSPSHFKNLFDVEADSCASSHIFPRSLMHGEKKKKNTAQPTSKHGGCLYTLLSDYNSVTVHCICILGL